MSGDERPLVLVAEDDPITSMALREQLVALDYRVLGPARDGNHAFALGACFPVDVALFDLRMPGRSGLDAARDLFDRAPTPVVLLTGYDPADLPDDIASPPIFARVTKPLGMTELGAAIALALHQFDQWRRVNPERDRRTEEGRRQRATIARAVQASADGSLPALSATALIARAREEGCALIDIARQILGEA